jgi:hypothetical protein
VCRPMPQPLLDVAGLDVSRVQKVKEPYERTMNLIAVLRIRGASRGSASRCFAHVRCAWWMIARRACLGALTIIAVPTGLARADELDRFKAEYPAAAAKLEQAYGHATILGTETASDGRGDFRMMTNCELLHEGDLVRGKQTVVRSAIPTFPPGTVSVSGGSGERSFEIFKVGPSGPFRFLFFGKAKDEGTYNPWTYAPLFCPYMVLTDRVTDFLGRSNVTLVSAVQTSWDGRPAIEIIAQLTKPNRAPFMYHFLFEPKTWALVGWVFPLTWTVPPAAWKADITYEPGSDPPRVKSLDKWVEGPDPQLKLSREHWEISGFKFGPIDPKEFDISAFGLNPPSDGATTQPAIAPSGTTTQPSQQGSSGTGGDTIGSIDLPVPLEANNPATSSFRLVAYSAVAVGLASVGAYFGIRAARIGSAQ